MFSLLLRVPLAALVAYVTAVAAAPSLSVKTSISNLNANGLKNLKVIATVTNTGGKTLKLLNDPRGVLDPFPENTFNVTNSAGYSPPFNGTKAAYNSTLAAGLDDPSTFTVLAPGDSIDVTHNLSAAYDFVQSGTGNYTIEPSNLFTHVDADGTPKDLIATVEDVAKVGLAVPPGDRGEYISFRSCSRRDRENLADLIGEAQFIIDMAYNYIVRVQGPTPRYTRWFGRYMNRRKAKVQEVFRRITEDYPLTGRTFDCRCRGYPEDTAAVAVLRPTEFIRICPAFWKDPLRFQVGSLIHEATHFYSTGNTEDDAYERPACVQLALKSTKAATSNADNYLFFAMNFERLR